MLLGIRSWVRRHPKWSIAIGLFAAFILWSFLKPTPKDYEYTTQAVDKGEVVRRVTASGKLRALNTIKVGAEV